MDNNLNKKTILYLITQSELGGAQQYIFDLAINLKNEFNIIVASGEQGKNGELAKKLEKNNIEFLQISHLKRAISPVNDIIAIWEIKKLIKKINPNIVHLNSSKISILSSLSLFTLHANKQIRIIYTVHGWVFNEALPIWKKLFYKYAEKITAKAKNKLICVSEYDRQIAIQEKICKKEKLITIHNGVDKINFYDKQESISKLNIKNLNLKENEIILGTIGNLYKTKGFEYLIKASKILKDKNLNFKLIIIGEGDERKNLEKLIQDLELKNNVFLIGKVNKASKLLKAFDIYICSSVKEGFPYTILEAMQAELPIVSTNVGGIPEMISHNQEGLLVNSKSENKLANSIIKLINEKETRKTFSNKAKEKVSDEFNLDKMITATKNIYNNI